MQLSFANMLQRFMMVHFCTFIALQCPINSLYCIVRRILVLCIFPISCTLSRAVGDLFFASSPGIQIAALVHKNLPLLSISLSRSYHQQSALKNGIRPCKCSKTCSDCKSWRLYCQSTFQLQTSFKWLQHLAA